MSAQQGKDQNSPPIYLQGVAGQYAGQKVSVSQAVVMGSAAEVEVTIDDPAIHPEHVRIMPYENRLAIENISGSDDIWVNGAVVQKQVLNSGDEIRLGRQRFVVKIPGLRPDSVLRDIPEKRGSGWLLWAVAALIIVGAAAAYRYWYLLQ